MHAEMLIENFDALAGASGGLAKLRSLILALAMRGTLTAQQDGDDSAAALETAALKLVSAKSRKHFADFEPFHSIPPHWKWVRLGAISNYSETTKIEPDASLPPETWVLELEDIEKETSALIRQVIYQDRNFQSTKNCFEAGYVLYGKLRPYLDKVLVADKIGVCTTEIIPFKPLAGICPHFIRWCLKSPDFIRYADNATHGMSLPRLGTPAALNAPVPLPPLAEQRRIVAKVDELMALCDRLEAQQVKQSHLKHTAVTAALNDQSNAAVPVQVLTAWELTEQGFHTLYDDHVTVASLRAALLSLAMQGKFHTQDDVDEAALHSLEKAGRVPLKSRSRQRDAAGQHIGDSEKPFAIPKGWEWVRLGALCELVTSGSRDWAKYYSDSGAAFVRMGNLSKGHYRMRLDSIQRVTPPADGEGKIGRAHV